MYRLSIETTAKLALLLEVRSSDPVKIVEQIGEDPRTFFRFGDWTGVDFRYSDISTVSFLDAQISGSVFRDGQLSHEQIAECADSDKLDDFGSNSDNETEHGKLHSSVVAYQLQSFQVGQYVRYPSHGVGQIVGIESFDVEGMSLSCFRLQFNRGKMIVRVPIDKVRSVGMSAITNEDELELGLRLLCDLPDEDQNDGDFEQTAQRIIAEGDIMEICGLLRQLGAANHWGNQQLKGVRNRVFQRLVEEVSFVKQIKLSKAKTYIFRQVQLYNEEARSSGSKTK